MAIGDPYMTEAQFRQAAGKIEPIADDRLLQALNASSRQIENLVGRQFNQSAAGTVWYTQAEPVYEGYSPWHYGNRCTRLAVGDFVAITQISTDRGDLTYDELLTADTHYQVAPIDPDLFEWPYTEVRALGSSAFPIRKDAVRITGTKGWPAIPAAVQEACFLLTNRALSLRKAPFGTVAGSTEMGGGLNMTAALTPMIREMLAPYRVMTV